MLRYIVIVQNKGIILSKNSDSLYFFDGLVQDFLNIFAGVINTLWDKERFFQIFVFLQIVGYSEITCITETSKSITRFLVRQNCRKWKKKSENGVRLHRKKKTKNCL